MNPYLSNEELEKERLILQNKFKTLTGHEVYDAIDLYFDFLIKEIKGNWRMHDKAITYLEDIIIEKI